MKKTLNFVLAASLFSGMFLSIPVISADSDGDDDLQRAIQLSLNASNIQEDEEQLELERAIQLSFGDRNSNFEETEEDLLNKAFELSFEELEKHENEKLDLALAESFMTEELRQAQEDDFNGAEKDEVAPVKGGLIGRIQQAQDDRRARIEAQQNGDSELNEKLKKRRNWEQ